MESRPALALPLAAVMLAAGFGCAVTGSAMFQPPGDLPWSIQARHYQSFLWTRETFSLRINGSHVASCDLENRLECGLSGVFEGYAVRAKCGFCGASCDSGHGCLVWVDERPERFIALGGSP